VRLYTDGSRVAHVRRAAVVLRAAPGSARELARVGTRTEFGSPTTFTVTGARGGWLEVISTELRNGVHGYVRRSAVRVSREPYSLEVDLSARQLRVWRWGLLARRLQVAIGSPASPTPVGRFALTDKLADLHPSVYGCCVLALSAHQTRLPPGWTGGDRIAIHGGAGIGSAVSNGCLHAATADLRWLMARLPLGTAVVIHP
jgi:hypothetical protein